MTFPQDQISWLAANRDRVVRWMFIPQLLVALLFLGFAYKTGRVHAHLLLRGTRTQGKIVGLKPVLFRSGSSSNSNSFSQTVYMPIIVFRAGDSLVHIEEWKGSNSDGGVGSMAPVLYDPSDPSTAMLDRGTWNWLPWGPCFAIGFLLALASLKGLFAFSRHQDARSNLSSS
jgi:Protein of unknown function (DUF3592)